MKFLDCAEILLAVVLSTIVEVTSTAIGIPTQELHRGDFPVKHHVFHSRQLADTKLRFVRNSGVCETTPGVGQISGYIDIGTNMSMVRFTVSHSFDEALIIVELSGSGSSRLDTIPIMPLSPFGLCITTLSKGSRY